MQPPPAPRSPTPTPSSPLGSGYRMRARRASWRSTTRQTLARSATLKYVHAEATNITFSGDDIKQTYHDFQSVHLVLFESRVDCPVSFLRPWHIRFSFCFQR